MLQRGHAFAASVAVAEIPEDGRLVARSGQRRLAIRSKEDTRDVSLVRARRVRIELENRSHVAVPDFPEPCRIIGAAGEKLIFVAVKRSRGQGAAVRELLRVRRWSAIDPPKFCASGAVGRRLSEKGEKIFRVGAELQTADAKAILSRQHAKRFRGEITKDNAITRGSVAAQNKREPFARRVELRERDVAF